MRALHHEEFSGKQWSGLQLGPHDTISERPWCNITWPFVMLHILGDIEDAHEILRPLEIIFEGHNTTSPRLSFVFMLRKAHSLF